MFVEYFVLARFLIEFAFVQEDVDLYKSSPPLPGTYCPFFLFFQTLVHYLNQIQKGMVSDVNNPDI